jgi:ABC-2 type transport system permease protein
MNTKVLFAVFKRNFVSYFASPTGYVFITVFVWLCVFAGFWSDEFFNANLANLGQLNRFFPFIMLVFIPAIAMSIWADERRQGTDELLLTIPAGDFEIVMGKYLAAVAIYTVSLVFSLVCTYAVLRTLGSPDGGLFLVTYIGYWLVGIAMLAVAMVASFLTSNLTVAFVLGALLNVPLVLAVWADSFFARDAGLTVKQWSIGEQVRDFGRGILTFSGLIYFVMLVAIMLYLSMVLIARRHWVRDKDWYLQAGHYGVRCAALAAAAIGLNVLLHHHDLRLDATSEKLSSLSPQTIEVLQNLDPPQRVQIDAFISPAVPEGYVQMRLNLISMLQELEARSGGKVSLRINDTEPSSEEAIRAEKGFGITPREVGARVRGTYSREPIFMGVSFACGLQKVVKPFIEHGAPLEYELIRSLATVTEQKRRRIGVVQTKAQLTGGMDFMGGSPRPREEWPIIKELKRAYDVVPVDLGKPLSEKVDVLLAVQPSSLTAEQMDNFLAAIKSGQPTAIFEDPVPGIPGVPGTGEAGRMPPMGGGPEGDVRKLWRLLDVSFSGMGSDPSPLGRDEMQVVYQPYNPLTRFVDLPPELVFVDRALVKDKSAPNQPINDKHPVTSKLQHVLFVYSGWIGLPYGSSLEHVPLVQTGDKAGTIKVEELFTGFGMFGPREPNPDREMVPRGGPCVLAAHIHSKGLDPSEPPKAGSGRINVILVSDFDVLGHMFFNLREQMSEDEEQIYDFDNITFVLNALDYLAGDDRFIEIRKRRPAHRTLEAIAQATEKARDDAAKTVKNKREQTKEAIQAADKELDDQVEELKKQFKTQNMTALEISSQLDARVAANRSQKQDRKNQLERERDQEIKQISRNLRAEVRAVQDRYKLWAVLLPPIPPLAIGIAVFVVRRVQEREGVSRKRLR